MNILPIAILAAALALSSAGVHAQTLLPDRSPLDDTLERSHLGPAGDGVLDDDWERDEFGYYDPDLDWLTGTGERERFDRWYGDSDMGWNDWYDDIGDDELFEIGIGQDEDGGVT